MLKIVSILLLSTGLSANAMADTQPIQQVEAQTNQVVHKAESEFKEAKEEIRHELKEYYSHLKDLREKRKALWEALSQDAKDFIKKKRASKKATKAEKDEDMVGSE